jgi:CSLREA domain-containing protein
MLRCANAIAWSRRASTAFARPSILIALLLVLVPLGVMLIPPAPKAIVVTDITVNTTGDSSTPGDGSCSLREAINNANTPGTDTTGGDCSLGTGTDTIDFNVNGTITLLSSLPEIQNTLTIVGSGRTITVSGGDTYQVLSVNAGATLTVNDLTIADGSAVEGGGIDNDGLLNVTNSTFSGNSAYTPGAGSRTPAR